MPSIPANGTDWLAALPAGASAPTYSTHSPQDLLPLGARTPYQLSAPRHLSSQSPWQMGTHQETAGQFQPQDSSSSTNCSPGEHIEHRHYSHQETEADTVSAFYESQSHGISVGEYNYMTFAPPRSCAQQHTYPSALQGQQHQTTSVPPQPLHEPTSTPAYFPGPYQTAGSMNTNIHTLKLEPCEDVLPPSIPVFPGNYTLSVPPPTSPEQSIYAGMAAPQAQKIMGFQPIACSMATIQAEPTTTPLGKKRKSMDEAAEGEDGEPRHKRRGRPRLTTKDETAIERRRTQIRMAQRAYRSRKDNAITILEQKVKALQKSQIDMSKEFTNFFNMISSQSGVFNQNPELAQRFQELNYRLCSYGKGEPLDEHSPASSPTFQEVDRHSAPEILGSNGRSQRRASGYSHSSPPFASYEVIAKPTTENASWPCFTPVNRNPMMPGWGQVRASANLPDTQRPPASYADQGIAFGHQPQRTNTDQAPSS